MLADRRMTGGVGEECYNSGDAGLTVSAAGSQGRHQLATESTPQMMYPEAASTGQQEETKLLDIDC